MYPICRGTIYLVRRISPGRSGRYSPAVPTWVLRDNPRPWVYREWVESAKPSWQAALAHDSEIRQVFPDGVYWLTYHRNIATVVPG